jgi:hypothetical protein
MDGPVSPDQTEFEIHEGEDTRWEEPHPWAALTLAKEIVRLHLEVGALKSARPDQSAVDLSARLLRWGRGELARAPEEAESPVSPADPDLQVGL